ncbi:hypothetical protein H8356DRAFT_1635175 [Neocallimastix lanati (nom. inval.)]|nr:hypothetical protein H8356DRAFT_1635175 [Neocallimastix sp. JGI-2020a]
MKILALISPLLVSYSVYALNTDFFNYYFENEINDLVFVNATAECINDIENISNNELYGCHVTLKDYQLNPLNACALLNSDRCQKFFKDPLGIIPNCKDYEEIQNTGFEENVKGVGLQLSLSCLYDEYENICPISKAFASGKELTEEDFKANCESKICTEETLKFITDLPEIYKDLDSSVSPIKKSDLNSVANYFKSEECAKILNSSGAYSTYKVGTTFIVSLGVLLLSLY